MTSVVEPQNLEAEERVCGALVLAGADSLEHARRVAARVCEVGLEGRHFYFRKHALVFDACLSLVEQGEPCDALLVRDELDDAGALEEVGDEARLHELVVLTTATANVGHHARLVVEAAERRERGEVDDIDDVELEPPSGSGSPAERLRLRALADVEPRSVRWLLPGLIPLRTLTLVAGIGGLGKSTWLAAVAARLSRGELLDGPAPTVVVSFEDAAEEALRPRLEPAGADLRLVSQPVLGREALGAVTLPRDVDELGRLVREAGARLVILDPVSAAIDVAYDAHKEQHVRVVLAELAALAEEQDCSIAMVGHLNKTPSTEPYIRISGSAAFWNAARSCVLVVGNPDEDERLIAQRKSNYARLHPVERHRIEEIMLPGTVDPDTGDLIRTARMTFVEFADDVDGSQVLVGNGNGEELSSGMEAVRFLVGQLADGRWHPSADVKDAAEAAGISERTLHRARKDLGVEDKGEGFPRVTYWRLSASRATPVVPLSPKCDGTTVETAWFSGNRDPGAPVVPSRLGVGPELLNEADVDRWRYLLEEDGDRNS